MMIGIHFRIKTFSMLHKNAKFTSRERQTPAESVRLGKLTGERASLTLGLRVVREQLVSGRSDGDLLA